MFGLNVGLTEKFESNSKPMKIHVSDPCKMLLDDRYVLQERTEGQELADKVLTKLGIYVKNVICAIYYLDIVIICNFKIEIIVNYQW